jgi:hypothetical protein
MSNETRLKIGTGLTFATGLFIARPAILGDPTTLR